MNTISAATEIKTPMSPAPYKFRYPALALTAVCNNIFVTKRDGEVCINHSFSDRIHSFQVNTLTSATVMLVGCFPWRNCGHHATPPQYIVLFIACIQKVYIYLE